MDCKYLVLIPLLPLLGALFHLIIGRRLGRGWLVNFVALGSVFGAFVTALVLISGPLLDVYGQWKSGGGLAAAPALQQTLYTWIEVGNLKLDLAFRLDTMSAMMVLIITFVGSLIHIYSVGYMAEDPRYATYFGYLNLFTGSMLILVLAANLPVMFIGWEGVGMCSYLLIGFWFTEEANANAGRKAFVVNRIGDFAFILGMCLLFWQVGSLDFSQLNSETAQQIFQKPYLGGASIAMFAGVLLFIGACGKSAQIPLYVWLPDAMAGPTPVSALIHAATMVTAGVYMVARLSLLYMSSATAMAVVAGIGALTALVAAIMAFAQTDLKKVLAYSTVSQLGFMFVGVGVGAYVAGLFHLLTHAFFKAGLFLGAGSVMHAMSGSGDIRKMGGLRKKLPFTHITFLIYCLAIAGIVPFSGFFSKDEILAGAFFSHAEGWISVYGELLWCILSVAALGTAFYMFRLYYLVFGGTECRADADVQAHIHESPPTMTVPLLILAGFTCVLGLIGLPHLHVLEDLGIANLLGKWLEPALYAQNVSPHSAGAILGLMGVALLIGIAGIVAAWATYRSGPSRALEKATAEAPFAGLYRVVFNKFYVDELYERMFIRPFRRLAMITYQFVDHFLIDMIFVRGSAGVVDITGRTVRLFQNGRVKRYLVAVLLGSALIVYYSTKTPAVGIGYKEIVDANGTPTGQVAFYPKVGQGPGSNGAQVQWYFSAESFAAKTPDTTVAMPTHQFSKPDQYQITLEWRSPMFSEAVRTTRTITVQGGL